MANPVKGQVALRVDGRTLILEFSIDALCQLEQHMGMTASEIIGKLGVDDSLTFKRDLLWGGLREHHPELDLRQAGELLRQRGGAAAGAKVIEAYLAAWPDPDPEDASAAASPRRRLKRAAPDGTGPTSSASGSSFN